MLTYVKKQEELVTFMEKSDQNSIIMILKNYIL